MFKRFFPLFADEPGAAGGGGDAGAAGGAPAAGSGDAGAGGAAPAAAATVLDAGKPAPAAPAGAAGDAPKPINERIPEKFRVNKEDGTLDLEASLTKVEEHRSHLEKRLGAGDIPPKTADEYKVNIPENLAEQFKAEDLAADPMLKSFMTDAHAAGMTQKQVDMVIGQYLERLPAIGGAMSQLSADECTATLKEVWKSDADYTQNVKAAYNAAKAYGGEDFEAILKDHGNDPRLVKLLASVGKELGEDKGTPAGSQGKTDAQNLQDEHTSLAGWLNNAKNHSAPEFEAKNRRYAELGKAIWGNAPRRSGSININTV